MLHFVAFINGLLIAMLLVGIVTIWRHETRFGLILALSMIAVLINAALFGTLVPFALKRLNIDPAIATGPFITTSNDVLGLMVYFGMISMFVKWI